MKKITSKTTLKDILDIEGAEKILMKNRIPCLSCPMASFEIESLEIGKVAKMYGLSLDTILKELNCLSKNDSKEKS